MSDRTPVSLMESDSGQLVEATLIEGVSRGEVVERGRMLGARRSGIG